MVKKMALLATMVLWGSLSVQASTGASPLGLVEEPVPGFEVSVWTDKSEYTVDEYAQIYIRLSRAAYVYVFNIDAGGAVRQIFPNWYSRNPYLPRGTHVLPDRPTYRLRVTGPEGVDTLQVIASNQPLPLGTGSPEQPYPFVAPDPREGRAVIQGLVPEPGPGHCVTAWTTFRVLSRPAPCPPGWGWSPYPTPPCGSPPHYYPPVGWGWYYHSGSWHLFLGNCPTEAQLCWYLDPEHGWRFSIRIRFGS